jgi:hypothetical protein
MTIANNDWRDGDRNLSKLAIVAQKRSATAGQNDVSRRLHPSTQRKMRFMMVDE